MSIAASLILIILVGKLAGVQATVSDGVFALSFGEQKPKTEQPQQQPSLTAMDVQQMINASVNNNNAALQANWKQTQEQLDASVRKSLATNSGKINELMKRVQEVLR